MAKCRRSKAETRSNALFYGRYGKGSEVGKLLTFMWQYKVNKFNSFLFLKRAHFFRFFFNEFCIGFI